MAYNCYNGYDWASPTSTVGLGGKMRETYSGKIANHHIIVNSWPELRIENSRFGMNGSGDFAATSFINITGGFANSQAGPNTVYAYNSQFNQGANTVAHWLYFTSCAGTCIGGASPVNTTEFRFSGVHVENIGTDFINSDSTWNYISYLGIDNSVFIKPVPFWALNSATGLSLVQLTNNYISASTFTLAPASLPFNELAIVGNGIAAPVSITSGSSGSTMSFTGNNVLGSVTFAGAWAGLAASGGSYTGTFSTTATGTINYSLPTYFLTNSSSFFVNGGFLNMNNATSNDIAMGAGSGAPAFTSRSSGEKVALHSVIDGSHTDFALGYTTNSMWLGSSTNDATTSTSFYGATTKVGSIDGLGDINFSGTMTMPGLSTAGTIAGSLCATSAGLVLYESGATSCTISLESVKKNLTQLDAVKALDDVMKLRPIAFEFKDPAVPGRRYGFGANQVHSVDPLLSTFDGHGDLQAFDPNGILANLVVVVQHQQREIDDLRRRLRR
jgi:hypothetical protein